jgi:hypothetical protein
MPIASAHGALDHALVAMAGARELVASVLAAMT